MNPVHSVKVSRFHGPDDPIRHRRTPPAQRGHALEHHDPDLFADANGIPKGADRTELYQHDLNWSNWMILGDSPQAMASLAERERLRGKMHGIHLGRPYGIKFNSTFQWTTTSRDVKAGNAAHLCGAGEGADAG